MKPPTPEYLKQWEEELQKGLSHIERTEDGYTGVWRTPRNVFSEDVLIGSDYSKALSSFLSFIEESAKEGYLLAKTGVHTATYNGEPMVAYCTATMYRPTPPDLPA